jgi:hypothetical protein
MRLLINLGGLVPLPADALVTPVTFRVRRRGLRGILAEFDAAEDGARELQAEWVVGRRLWRRLQAEWRALHTVRPAGADGLPSVERPGRSAGKGRVILFLHGGARAAVRTVRGCSCTAQAHIIASPRRRTG